MDFIKDLNEKQYLACTSDAKYLRIIAGAGTGKTRTLTYRIAYLISSGITPSKIVAITFTNKVAKEMQTRVADILASDFAESVSRPLISTFHGFCYRFLRREISVLDGYTPNFTVLDEQDKQDVYKQIFSKMLKGASKDFTKAIDEKISQLKTDGKFVSDITESDVPYGALYNFSELQYVYSNYQSILKRQNLLDFDDLLMFTYKIMMSKEDIREYYQHKYSCYLIDEFQDTNRLQYELVKLFLGENNSLTVVGDPDQTIYSWRGAKNEIIKTRLMRDFPNLETIVLDDNYRSTQAILDTANKLIKHNRDRVDKELNAASHIAGEKVSYFHANDAEREAFKVASTISKLVLDKKAKYSDIAIIYRANYLSNNLEKQLTAFRIPYEIYGGLKFYERAEIKDALAYLRLVVNPDDMSFKRILKAPTKGIGEVSLAKANELLSTLADTNSLLDVFKDHQDMIKLNKNSIKALEAFFKAYNKFKAIYNHHESNFELITGVRNYLSETGFLDYVKSEDVKNTNKYSFTASSSVSKVANVEELLHDLQGYLENDELDEEGQLVSNTLEGFLMNVALQSDQDTMQSSSKVSLMTGHVSKGLEFPYVFVTGLNQGIFPSQHSLSRNSGLEEERRLCYVCMTRAKKKLYLSSFDGKNFRSGGEYVPSIFLEEAEIDESDSKDDKLNRQAYEGLRRPSFNSVNTIQREKTLSPAKVTKAAPTDDKYVIGDRVVHTSFGVGKVVAVKDNKSITVDFPEPFGRKILIIGFKAFRKVKEDE